MINPYASKKSKIMGAVLSVFLLFISAGSALAQESQEEKKAPEKKPRGKEKIAGPLEFTVPLNDLWYIQSSERVKAGGEELSQPGVRIENWYPALVPSTILGTLVQNSIYTDIFHGKNLASVPVEPFRRSWWYRREFIVPAGPDLTRYRLEFDGINYRANVWLNGKLVADAAAVFGSFRRFSIDITPMVKTTEKNVLAVEVIPPEKGEPTIGFVDWNPAPPDGNLGLWREVRIKASGDVSMDHVFVRTRLNTEKLDEARLAISAELENSGDKKHEIEITGRLEKLEFKKSYELMPGEKKTVVISAEDTPELIIKSPRIWWTHDLGKPELYRLFLSLRAGGRPSDMASVRFGIREISDYFNEDGHRGYMLNGKKILIRGGGWTDDMLLAAPRKKLAAEIAYARHMNLNALRFEGFWGSSQAVYDLCDENGLLIMVGWSCHWEWENYLGKPADERYGGIISTPDIALISQSWEDQVKWLRNHPSIFVWAQASDKLPKPELEREFIRILKEADPDRPTLVSTKGLTSEISGKSGVKMLGPYDYVPPVYWYIDQKNGGAYGFNTETGPGPQVPPLESLKRMIPEKDLWPVNDVWNFHCCRGRFTDLARYNEAMDKRLGPARGLEDYLRKAQFLNYEGMRAMFEAFTANKGPATGIIQWMYNSAWPKLWWQLYDYYLMPNGAFYGARKACSPVHLVYNYGTREILAVNNTLAPAAGLKAEIKLYALDLKQTVSKTIDVSLAAGQKKVADILAVPPGASTVHFLDMRLLNPKRKPVSINFYVLPAGQDTLDQENATWYVTPVKDYADLKALENLPPAMVKARAEFKARGALTRLTIDLENTGRTLAFQLEIQIYRAAKREPVLPIFLDDNYISLLPKEKRRITGYFLTEDLLGDKPELVLRGWNLEEKAGR